MRINPSQSPCQLVQSDLELQFYMDDFIVGISQSKLLQKKARNIIKTADQRKIERFSEDNRKKIYADFQKPLQNCVCENSQHSRDVIFCNWE